MKLYLDKLVAYGGFSRVYVAHVTASSTLEAGAVVAVKKVHTTKHIPHPVLRHEACAYILLQGHTSVPTVYAWGQSQFYEYLALELLGPDVLLARGTTLRNLVVLTCEMIDALKHVHSHGLIHGDIKPANFLFSFDFGARMHANRLKLVDYGLAAPFRDSNGVHVSARSTGHLRGTVQYASIQVHMHHTPTRRDDFESLAYTLVDVARGGLPWGRDSDPLRAKLACPGCVLCAALPSVFGAFVDYTQALDFAATPDYARWRNAFRALVPDLSVDAVYDPDDDGPRVSAASPSAEELPPGIVLPDVRQLVSENEDDDDFPDSDDGWMPTSSWPAESSIAIGHLIGDEVANVNKQLERIEDPPAMAHPWLQHYDSPETMVL